MKEKNAVILALGPGGTNGHAVSKFVNDKMCGGDARIDLEGRNNVEVLNFFSKGRGDIAVIPTANGRGGLVDEVLRFWISSTPDDRHLFLSGGCMGGQEGARIFMAGEVEAVIHHQLLAPDSVSDPKELKAIFSHPQALAQCSRLLRELGISSLPANSTAGAAEDVAGRKSESFGAIASRLAGEIYGLKVLVPDIEDETGNTTLFHVLGRRISSETGNDRTTLLFWLPNTPGALNFALSPIASARINMSDIKFIPLGKLREVAFYVEIDGHVDDPVVRSVLAVIARATERMSILGSFPKGEAAEM